MIGFLGGGRAPEEGSSIAFESEVRAWGHVVHVSRPRVCQARSIANILGVQRVPVHLLGRLCMLKVTLITPADDEVEGAVAISLCWTGASIMAFSSAAVADESLYNVEEH